MAMSNAAQTVSVRVSVFNTAADMWEHTTETWTLTGKYGRCSMSMIRSPKGFETEVYLATGVVHLSRRDMAKLGMGNVTGEGARVLGRT